MRPGPQSGTHLKNMSAALRRIAVSEGEGFGLFQDETANLARVWAV